MNAGRGAEAVVEEEHRSADGSARLRVRFADGATVESVLLHRGSLCVSTQAGCAVGCLFCRTGGAGLARNLSAEEICAQAALARERRPVRRVLFMGMGEPSHNLANVLAAAVALRRDFGIGRRNVVFSTVGSPSVFERLLAAEVRPALALSLHATGAALRTRLLPRAPRIEPRELYFAAQAYADATRTPLQVQWTLLRGVNDGDEETEQLLSWLRGRRAIVNFIPWNDVPGADFARPDLDRCRSLVRRFHRGGVLAKLRWSVASDVSGACGQLCGFTVP
jgi:23S rRNA (adenine2503-C2)-methyltransferase